MQKELVIEIPKEITSLEDAINFLGEEDSEVKQYRKLIASGITGHTITTQQLVVVIRALNDKWVPDWDNSHKFKYYPWFELKGNGRFYGSFCCNVHSRVPARFCFESKEISDYAGEQFESLYLEYLKW